jgi:hypothetical protein
MGTRGFSAKFGFLQESYVFVEELQRARSLSTLIHQAITKVELVFSSFL